MSIFYINKTNLINNVKTIKRNLNDKVLFCAMVKANAYSHSAVTISKIIEEYVDYFGVANIPEGIELRENGINKPILCVGSLIDTSDYILANKYNIDIIICNNYTLNLAIKSGVKLNIHIKLDTGMNRLGFKSCKEIENAYNLLNQNRMITIKGVMSHFVDSQADKKKTNKQLEDFLIKSSIIKPNNIIFHISNSSAIKYRKYNLNMVRCGLSLYGYGDIKGLKPVLRITAEVVDIHKAKKGESVGYNGVYVVKKDEIIATINFGYADGLDLRYKGYFVKINHKNYEIIGKICMDMFMVKVDEKVKIGDEVVILNNAIDLAIYSKKSVYEVLSNFKEKRAKIIVE